MNHPTSWRAAVALAFITFGGLSRTPAQDSQKSPTATIELPSAGSFLTPADDARVHVWWHWMDGAITREGITKDLEVMKAQGVAQATILNIGLFEGRDFGVPRVVFASPEWFAMYRWALAEAGRLGITLGVHNCDGWSSSGGPWISPEQSMKQYTWTKVLITGGRPIDVSLAQPAEVAGFYRDVAVVAYRTSRQPSAYRTTAVTLQVNDHATDTARLTDGNPNSGVPLRRGDRLVLASPAPLEFTRVALHLREAFMWSDPAQFLTQLALEASNDGQAYRPLAELTLRGLNHNQIIDVPRTTARFVRITVRETSDPEWGAPVSLGEFELLRAGEDPADAPSIPFLGEKTSTVKGADAAVNAIGTDAQAVPPRDVVMLTGRMDAAGRLRWDAPAGTWAVLRFGYTSTGATNGPATREGRGLECDKMDAAAVEHHFHAFVEKLIDEAGDRAGRTLKFILVDSWEAGFQNWTAALPAEFERRRGYSLLPWLPVLTGQAVSSARESEAVLFDLRQTIADLIRENYYDRLAALLHARKIELHAEVIYGGAGYPPLDILRATQNVDLPMLEFWSSANQDSLLEYTPVDAPSLELPPCAAVGYGKPLVGSEAYTGYAHYSETPAGLTPFGSRGYAGGINRMILHSSVHQPTDDRPGMTLGQFASHFNRNNLYWPHAASWLEYHARIQSLLGVGMPDFDVLYFLGDQLPEVYARNASTSLPPGYALTAVNADLLATRVIVADGRLRLNGQGAAALLSLPPEPAMSLDTLRRLEVLVREGAQVYGPKPERTLSLADGRSITEFRALADRVWGQVDGKSVRSHAYGKGGVSWGRPIGQVLADLHVVPQFAAKPAGRTDFLFTHRRSGPIDIFFVANQTDQALERECTFRVGGKTPEIWDPETGAVERPAAFRVEGGQLSLSVQFRPRQALLFVFRAGLPAHFVTSIDRGGKTLFPSAGRDAHDVPQLRFEGGRVSVESTVTGACRFGTNGGRVVAAAVEATDSLPVGGLPGTLELEGAGVPPQRGPFEITDLRPLTEYASPEIRYFSGEAIYRLKFSLPQFQPGGTDAWRLDIGGFDAIAEVSLNGQPLGQLWRPGVALDVTGRLRRDNELTVRVVNVYRNRLIGDLAQSGEVKTLRTSAPVSQFLSAKSPLKPSGLFGPIKLLRVPRQLLPEL